MLESLGLNVDSPGGVAHCPCVMYIIHALLWNAISLFRSKSSHVFIHSPDIGLLWHDYRLDLQLRDIVRICLVTFHTEIFSTERYYLI